MAKLSEDPKVQELVAKATDKALKARNAEIKKAIAALEMPEGTTARAAAAIKQAVRSALLPA